MTKPALDRATTIPLVIGMIGLVTIMWLGLKHMVGESWYTWIDPTMITLLIIMVITGALTIITTPKKR